jgi:uncharacterized protein GlcG (DUF336 family)
MHRLTLAQANAMIEAAFAKGAQLGLKPLTVSVLDPGGNFVACQRQDGPGGNIRAEIAAGKARGALAMGLSSRTLGEMAEARPHFVGAIKDLGIGGVVPVAGGLIVADSEGTVLGGIGISGDTSDNDEACALAGIAAVGLKPLN